MRHFRFFFRASPPDRQQMRAASDRFSAVKSRRPQCMHSHGHVTEQRWRGNRESAVGKPRVGLGSAGDQGKPGSAPHRLESGDRIACTELKRKGARQSRARKEKVEVKLTPLHGLAQSYPTYRR